MDLKLHIKLMLLTKQLHDSRSGGRELLCKLNHDALKEIYGENFILCELKPSLLKGMKSIFDAFRGHIDGLNDGVMEEALQKIHTDNVSKVFVDGSNLGEFAKVVKRRFPQVQVSTFFHNVEARFFLGSLRQAKSPRALAVLMVNYLAERKAVRYSDKIICMSERDSRLLERLYGSAATHVSPMALEDKLPINNELTATPQKENFALFVGGVFYANRAGITWFVKHVVPNIQIKICIVGRGFEDFKHELESEGKVVVVGAVDSLADWYRNALFVIAPIFDGSGMKTKVAEALMFGKRIVGTAEAFSGYEDITDQVGWRCTTADEFVDAISRAQREIEFGFDPQLRALYEKRYSLPAARDRLAKILSSSSTDS
jgi:polysaccharide biosynthesis protein PslH